MKILLIVLLIIVTGIAFSLIKNRSKSNSSSVTVSNKNLSMEEKLDVLARNGLKLVEPFTLSDLLESWDREQYEKPGYDLVLVGLGMTEEKEPWRNHSENIWHFDTEAIEDNGDYKRIVERMVELTQGSLKLENIIDHVDLEKEEAWFSYKFQGEETRVDCKVEDDWVDTSIFAKFVEMLSIADPSKIYIYYDLGGQDCIIGCITKEQLRKLNSDGIKFVALT